MHSRYKRTVAMLKKILRYYKHALIHKHQSCVYIEYAAVLFCKAAVQCFNSSLLKGSRETANYSIIIIVIGLTLRDLTVTSYSLKGFIRALSAQSYPYDHLYLI